MISPQSTLREDSLLEQNWLAHRTNAEIEVAVMRSQYRVWRVQRISVVQSKLSELMRMICLESCFDGSSEAFLKVKY